MDKKIPSGLNFFGSETVQLHKILHFGFKDYVLADMHSIGYTVWFDVHSYFPYATIQHRLAEAYYTAELTFRKGYDQPFLINIFFPGRGKGPYKDGDPESSLTHMIKWLERMVPPNGPLIIKIFIYSPQESDEVNFGLTDGFNCIWPFKKVNPSWNSRHITLQKYENQGAENEVKATRNHRGYEIQQKILEEAERRNISVFEVGYETRFDQAFDYINEGLGHFSYFGATYYMAAAMQKNSYVFGYLNSEDDKIAVHANGAFLRSVWHGNRVTQFEVPTRKIYNGPVDHFSYIDNDEQLKQVFDEIENAADKKSCN